MQTRIGRCFLREQRTLIKPIVLNEWNIDNKNRFRNIDLKLHATWMIKLI